MTPTLDAAWAALVSDGWDSDERHDKFVNLVAAEQGAWTWAATKYRERGDDPRAARALDRLTKAAMAVMYASGTPADKRRTPGNHRALIGFLVMLVLAAVLLVILLGLWRK